ncbi:MAG TPA: type VI secretion system tip protein TssI/VgrG [Polyangia bacterium]|nr:type VI secretion system tip protein TssI/VgrG [Polyangia bacterium]
MPSIRSVEVISPVGQGKVVFERMSGGEALGRPFEYDVDILSPTADLVIADAVGKRMTVEMGMGNHPPRFFNGLVARFSLVAWTGENFRYRAKLRPWLWILSRSSNSRIFQGKSVVDVLRKIFEEHGFSGDIDASGLDQGSYKPVEYLVQYHETDFNFVSRLMEQAGIYYWFRHEHGKHVMVLCDGVSHDKVPGYEAIPFFVGDPSSIDKLGHQHIAAWSLGLQVEPGGFAAKEFDFEKPRAPLLSVLSAHKPGTDAKLQVFEYPGLYLATDQRDAYVARRLEEQQQQSEMATGAGNARGIRPGACFALTDYPAEKQNQQYLVTAASYTLSTNAYSSGSGQGGEGEDFQCSFFAIDSKHTFRTPLTTPKPTVAGPQTAIVVGKGGEEIWTDKYGRVKVQFHWDREGKSNEQSSCWVRVSQAWAGPKWGSIHIPRMGQEVIVDFLEGDPDRPIITGRVYNADNMPPYDLPANQTQSGIKSRSTKGGAPANFNELRFEDKKGSEEVYLQAEKDLTSLVKNDEHREVGHDRTTEIKNDETITVDGNRTETVKKNETITINGTRTETVDKDETITVTGARSRTVSKGETISISKDQTISVGENRSTTVGKNESTTVSGAQTLDVTKDQSVTVSGARTLNISKDDTVSIGGKLTISVSKDESLEVGKKLVVDAGDEIVLQSGEASIILKKSGEITIKGKNITLDAGGKVNVKASGDVIIKGSKVTQN